jgi:hypothetical protein
MLCVLLCAMVSMGERAVSFFFVSLTSLLPLSGFAQCAGEDMLMWGTGPVRCSSSVPDLAEGQVLNLTSTNPSGWIIASCTDGSGFTDFGDASCPGLCVQGGFVEWRVSDGRSCGADLPDLADGQTILLNSTAFPGTGLHGVISYTCASGLYIRDSNFTCTGPCASETHEWPGGCSFETGNLTDGTTYTGNSTSGVARGQAIVHCIGGALTYENLFCTSNCTSEQHTWRGVNGGFDCSATIPALADGQSAIVNSTAGPAGLVGFQNVTCTAGGLSYPNNFCTSPCAAVANLQWPPGVNTCSGSTTQLADGATQFVSTASGNGNVTVLCGGGQLILINATCGPDVTAAVTTAAGTTATSTAAGTTSTTAAQAVTTTTAAQAVTTTTAAPAATTTTAAPAVTTTTAAAQAATTTTAAQAVATTTPVAVPALADLNLVKDDCVTSVVPGGSYTYKLTVNNTGGSTAAGVIVTDSWPFGQLQVTSLPAQCTPGTTTISCSLGSIAPGGSVAVSIGYLVRGNAVPGTQVSNCATVSSASGESNVDKNGDCDLNTVAGGCLGYDRSCANNGDCCPPLQCLRHASSCNGTVVVEFRCVARGGSSITIG